MVFNLKDFKEVCSKILFAVDSSDGSQISDTLSVIVENGELVLSVTNKEYYTKVKLPVGDVEDFKASVNAGLFLRLVSSLTAETIDLSVVDNYLKVVSDGTFKIPLIYDGDELLEVPEIKVVNKTQEFDIKTSDLLNILVFNSKEAGKKSRFAVMKMYYLDQDGCITFTTGACVNKFQLDGTLKILLTQKVVRLFKLFSSDTVHFELGYDELESGVVLTKVSFYNDSVNVSAILTSDENLINSVPADVIRKTAYRDYEYSVNFNKDAILNTLKRFLLFTNDATKCIVTLKFDNDGLYISDAEGNNATIAYDSNSNQNIDYSLKMFAEDLRLTLESVSDKFVVFSFGNHQAVVIAKGNIYNVVPEIVVKG